MSNNNKGGRNRRNKKKGGKQQKPKQAANQPTPISPELEKWDDENNEYLRVLRTRLRNRKKKMDKISKWKEMDRSELNVDQLASLRKAPVHEEVYLALTNVFNMLKGVAKKEADEKNPQPKKVTVDNSPPAVASPTEEKPPTPVPAPPAKPDTETESLLKLFHASTLAGTEINAIHADLNASGVQCTTSELRNLMTITSIITGQFNPIESLSPSKKFSSAVNDANAYLSNASISSRFVPSMPFGRIRELIRAITCLKRWNNGCNLTTGDSYVLLNSNA